MRVPAFLCPFVPGGGIRSAGRLRRGFRSEEQLRGGDAVDVDQEIELIGEPFVPEFILPSQRADVAELHAVDPFEGG